MGRSTERVLKKKIFFVIFVKIRFKIAKMRKKLRFRMTEEMQMFSKSRQNYFHPNCKQREGCD